MFLIRNCLQRDAAEPISSMSKKGTLANRFLLSAHQTLALLSQLSANPSVVVSAAAGVDKQTSGSLTPPPTRHLYQNLGTDRLPAPSILWTLSSNSAVERSVRKSFCVICSLLFITHVIENWVAWRHGYILSLNSMRPAAA